MHQNKEKKIPKLMQEQLDLNDLSSENLENELKNLSYIKKKMIK